MSDKMSFSEVYFVEFRVRDGLKLVEEFTQKYKFSLIARRSTDTVNQWVVRSGKAVCLVTQHAQELAGIVFDNETHNNDERKGIYSRRDPYVVVNNYFGTRSDIAPHFYGTQCIKEHDAIVDTVCNVALKVKDVGRCIARMEHSGATILKPHTSISDRDGTVEIAVVKSCVGNVIHTLVNNDNYSGVFLPHFEALGNDSNSSEKEMYITHFDHVTFACTFGSLKKVLNWYEQCFGMRRFLMNRDEDEDHGFVIETADIGLRLKAMEYWHCAEVGLTSPCPSSRVASLKFVVAEALPDHGPNQVDTFLREHGGPGIQHVGLHTPDMVKTVSSLHRNGVCFAEPPLTYYTEIGKLKDIQESGQNVSLLKEHGILVDAEEDPDEEINSEKTRSLSTRYLMQKFTKPLFDRNTFFLEVIHRAGATGFGSGNIAALWRSLKAYLTVQEANSKIQSKEEG